MADLLPSTPDTSAADEPDPRVVGLDDEAADELLGALSSTTARELLDELHDEPAPPSDLADRVDTTLQNAQYHLDNLADAGLIEVVDTAYSAKGREMDIYAPADRPLVVFAGTDEAKPTVRSVLSRLLGGLGILAIVSFLIEVLAGDRLAALIAPSTPGPQAGDDSVSIATESADVEADAATSLIETLPPSVLFFLGGTVMLVTVLGYQYWR